MDDSTVRLSLPSGGWADFRTSVTYAARRRMRHYATNIAASVGLGRDRDVQDIKVAASEVVAASEADDYLPIVAMLVAWSYPGPLPTMEDLTPLDALSWEDGEFLFEQAHAAFANHGQVDFSPNTDPKEKLPTTNSDESGTSTPADLSTNGVASPRSLSSIASPE